MAIDDISRNLNILDGQAVPSSEANNASNIMFTAIVRNVEDFANQGRIRAEIMSTDGSTGDVVGGKDRNTETENMPIAYPLMPDFHHSSPQVGEMVIIFLSNPSDIKSRRYWIGPIRTTRYPRDFESYGTSESLFKINTFSKKNSTTIEPESSDLPNINEIFIKGKDDSDIVFKSREIMMRAGTFVDKTSDLNTNTVCNIQMVQKDLNPDITPFSQINIKASNINLISTDSSSRKYRALDEDGKLVDVSNIEKETNERLKDFGDEANRLHPLVLGDELVKLLKVIIRFCITHKHTPQETPYAPTDELNILNQFLSDETIKGILSNTVRTN